MPPAAAPLSISFGIAVFYSEIAEKLQAIVVGG
jgi:hypothetical protein